MGNEKSISVSSEVILSGDIKVNIKGIKNDPQDEKDGIFPSKIENVSENNIDTKGSPRDQNIEILYAELKMEPAKTPVYEQNFPMLSEITLSDDRKVKIMGVKDDPQNEKDNISGIFETKNKLSSAKNQEGRYAKCNICSQEFISKYSDEHIAMLTRKSKLKDHLARFH